MYEPTMFVIGSGFSNLRDVLTLKPDILKVDRAIVRGIDRDRVKAAIVDGLNRMASQLEIPLLAEGIESREELAVLDTPARFGGKAARATARSGSPRRPGRPTCAGPRPIGSTRSWA